MSTRIFWGGLLVAVITALLIIDHKQGQNLYLTRGILALLAGAGALELLGMMKQAKAGCTPLAVMVLQMGVLGLGLREPGVWMFFFFAMALMMVLIDTYSTYLTAPDRFLDDMGTRLGALLYVGGGVFCLSLALGLYPQPVCVLVWFLLSAKGTDIGGYFTGKFLGKNKMAPTISPNKTWEGFAGGMVLSLGFSLGVQWWLSPFDSYLHAGGLSLFVGAFAVVGDLFESMIKRTRQVKDSGNLIPSFGGVLDMIDSLLWAGPVFLILTLLGQGEITF